MEIDTNHYISTQKYAYRERLKMSSLDCGINPKQVNFLFLRFQELYGWKIVSNKMYNSDY